MSVVIGGYQVARRMPPMVGELRKRTRDGVKTQTRRLMSPQASCHGDWGCSWNGLGEGSDWGKYCPMGRVGDLAVMPEPLCKGESGLVVYRDDGWIERRVLSDQPGGGVPWKWKVDVLSSMFMPVWAGRTVVRYTRVDAEQLLDVCDGEAAAEGFLSGKDEFFAAWNKLSKPGYRSKDNPWVWVLEWELLVVDGKPIGGMRGN